MGQTHQCACSGSTSKCNDTLLQQMSYALHGDIMICHLIFMKQRTLLTEQTSLVPLSARTHTKDPFFKFNP